MSFQHDRQLRARGMALVLVLAVIALASMIGLAMLSSTSLQARVSHNAAHAETANYLAESAVQAGLYYLQYPSRRPTDWSTTPGYYIHAMNQSLGSGVSGSFDLQVQPTSERDKYTIRAVGRASADSPTRVITVTASVDRASISAAGHFGGNVTIPSAMSVTGPVQAEGTITNNSSSTPSITTVSGPLPATSYQVPTVTTVNWYGANTENGKYICPDGTIGYAQQLTSAPTSTPAVAANNPGKIFYYTSTSLDLALSSSVTINGTLVVKGCGVSIRAPSVVINPAEGFPALIVEKDLNIYRTSNKLEANGVVWVGRNLTWSPNMGFSTSSSATIKGALLMPSSSPINAPGSGGTIVLQQDSTKMDVPDLGVALQPAKSVKVLSWDD